LSGGQNKTQRGRSKKKKKKTKKKKKRGRPIALVLYEEDGL